MNQYLGEAFDIAAILKKKYKVAEETILQLLLAVLVSVRSGRESGGVRFNGVRQSINDMLEQLKREAVSWCQVDLASIFIRGVVQCDLDTLQNVSDNDLADEYDEAVGVIVQEAEDRLKSVSDTVQRNINEVLAVVTLTLLSTRLIKPVIGERISPPMQNVRIDNLQKELTERGLTGFIDRRGSQLKMQTYVDTVLDNNIIQAYRKGYTMRMMENGFDLVDVLGGIHENSCEPCIDIVTNNPVLSVTGATPGYMTIAEAEAEGLGHMNCVHYYQYHNTANPNAG